jgi:hypothetical protein
VRTASGSVDSGAGRGREWVVGALIAAAAGCLYVALRPPLYHFDGYMYRLKALEPFSPKLVNPHHLLWHFVQMGLVRVEAALGRGDTVPLQWFGIAVNCLTLFCFHRLLSVCARDRLFAAAATVFLSLSPTFWHMGFQNLPYPLTYLFVVLFFLALCGRPGEETPTARLVWSGAAISAAIFMQQAAVLLVPAGIVAIAIGSRGRIIARWSRAMLWATSAGILVLGTYVGTSWIVGARSPDAFLRWITTYMHTEHPLQIRMPAFIGKAFIGIARSSIQGWMLEGPLLEHFSGRAILILYSCVGLLAIAAVAVAWRLSGRRRFADIAVHDPAFAAGLISVAAWSAFVFSWEPTGHFWNLILFPGLLCFAVALRESALRGRPVLVGLLVAVSLWNLNANHDRDRFGSINFPDPLLATVRSHVGPRDLFLVLGRDWFADMDYDLLFECLDRSGGNPGRALLEDFVLEQDGDGDWRAAVAGEVESTIEGGGRVFLADHVLWPESYSGLRQEEDPYSEFVDTSYRTLDTERLRHDVEELFSRYELREDAFTIGRDSYWEVRARGPKDAR